MKPIEVYASNLHSGGGMTASATTINCMVQILRKENPGLLARIEFVVSRAVRTELLPKVLDSAHFTIRDDVPRRTAGRGPGTKRSLRLILLGPDYWRRSAELQICGFADATSFAPLDPSGATAARSSTPAWKGLIKRKLLGRYDEYVVQTQSAAKRLDALVGPKPIHVIPNSIHPVLMDESAWDNVRIPVYDPSFMIAFYPAGPFAHKNHQIIPAVGRALRSAGSEIRVVTTLPLESKMARALEASDFVINIGPRPVSQLPSLYLRSDVVFFPSRLETFSSVVIEAQYFGRPLVASDRPFVRETAGSYPIYFDPDSAASAAQALRSLTGGLQTPARPIIALSKELEGFSPWRNARRYVQLLSRGEQ